jgi:hypothetical protein
MKFNSLFTYVLSSRVNGQLESPRIETATGIRQHRKKRRQTTNDTMKNKEKLIN